MAEPALLAPLLVVEREAPASATPLLASSSPTTIDALVVPVLTLATGLVVFRPAALALELELPPNPLRPPK